MIARFLCSCIGRKEVELLKPSKEFHSLPIVSLSEGQHIGYVKSLVVDAQSKALAALVIDPKGFFKDQRIIPYSKVVSVGEDAITIDKGSYVEKSASLPEILQLIKERLSIIGTRIITQNGKTLGVVDEYYINPTNGQITQVEISGGKIEGFFSGKALLDAQYLLTIGQDVIVAQQGSESHLLVADKGINESLKSLLHSTTNLASETSASLSKFFNPEKIKGRFKGIRKKEKFLASSENITENNPLENKDSELEQSIQENPNIIDVEEEHPEISVENPDFPKETASVMTPSYSDPNFTINQEENTKNP